MRLHVMTTTHTSQYIHTSSPSKVANSKGAYPKLLASHFITISEIKSYKVKGLTLIKSWATCLSNGTPLHSQSTQILFKICLQAMLLLTPPRDLT